MIAVPGANATTNLTSNAALTVAANDVIVSGEDTNLAAETGTSNATATGVGHGTSYILFGIPISYTNGSSSTSTPSSSTVTIDGTVTAGYYHELSIVIPKNITNTSQITFNADGQPYIMPSVYLTADFNPVASINDTTTGNLLASVADALMLAKGYVAQGPVGAIGFGPLSAAGGDVTVDAGTLTGSGRVTAYGGATISIINNSPDYLVLDSIEIQGPLGGNINFTGAATMADAKGAGIAVNPVNTNAKPLVNIQEEHDQQVGTSQNNIGPGVFLGDTLPTVPLTGTLASNSTLVTVNSTVGLAIGQTVTDPSDPGAIPAGTTITTIDSSTEITLSAAPTGSSNGPVGLSADGIAAVNPNATVNVPGGQVTINVADGTADQRRRGDPNHPQRLRRDLRADFVRSDRGTTSLALNWNSDMTFPGPTPALAIAWVANAIADSGGTASEQQLNQEIIGNADDAGSTAAEFSTVWFTYGNNTSPIPYSEDTLPSSLNPLPSGTSQSQALSFDQTYLNQDLAIPLSRNSDGTPSSSQGSSDGWFPEIPVESLYKSVTTTPVSTQSETFTGTLTPGSNVVTAVSNSAGLSVGETVTGTDIPYGTTVTAINSSAGTITLSADPIIGGPQPIPNVRLTAGFSSSINAQGILIDARFIDVNGTINVGQSNNQSVVLPSYLTSTGGAITVDQYDYAHGISSPSAVPGQPRYYTLPVSATTGITTSSPGDQQITARYDAITGQVIVNNVAAASGGSVTLNGAIVSTDTMGNINVGDGLGQVSIVNQTKIPVVVQNVTASQVPDSASPTEVDIDDTSINLASANNSHGYYQTLYVYNPGAGIEEYKGLMNADPQQLQAGLPNGSWLPPTYIQGTSTTYQPLATLPGTYFEWQYQATLSRTENWPDQNGNVNYNGLSNYPDVPTFGPWVFDRPPTMRCWASRTGRGSLSPISTPGTSSTQDPDCTAPWCPVPRRRSFLSTLRAWPLRPQVPPSSRNPSPPALKMAAARGWRGITFPVPMDSRPATP